MFPCPFLFLANTLPQVLAEKPVSSLTGLLCKR
jgi:hypothetical protein